MSKVRKKTVTMTVTVSGPAWMTAAQARREVRSLINGQCFAGSRKLGTFDEIDEYNFRASKVSA